MVLRVTNFVGKRSAYTAQRGHTKGLEFQITQRAMLQNITDDDARYILKQCADILSGNTEEHTIYISGITALEEVTNE